MSRFLFDVHAMTAPIRKPEIAGRIRSSLGVQVSGGSCGLIEQSSDLGQVNGACVNALVEAPDCSESCLDESGNVLMEYETGDETYCMQYDPSGGLLRIGVVHHATERVRQCVLLPNKDSAEPILALLIHYSFIHQGESNLSALMESFDKMVSNPADGNGDLSQIAAKICDNIKVRVENPDDVPAGIRLAISVPTSNVVPLGKSDIYDAEPERSNLKWFGRSRLRTNGVSSPLELAGRYRISDRKLTEEETDSIPQVGKEHVVADETIEICESIYHSTGTGYPMRNFLMTGPSGLGKTEIAKVISMGIRLPYKFFTCSASTEEFNFIGQMLPRTEDGGVSVSGVWTEHNLPTAMDIFNDPGTAFAIMTGKYKEDATESECVEMALRVARAVIADHKRQTDTGRQASFRYVRTPFIDAVEKGYVVEIQEPSVIVQPGVLVGLNSLLEKDGGITLVTGEYIRRHPDTVIILTSNTDYVACRDVDQSLISRMDEVFDFGNLTKDAMISRVKSKIGFDDDMLLTQMANTILDIQKYCKDHRISDGVVGMRELYAWVSKFNIVKDPVKAARRTVIPSATRNKDRQADLIKDCLKSNFAA